MSTELTQTAIIKSEARVQEPQIVLQIDGVDTIFGIGQIKKFIRVGDPGLLIGEDWKIGGLNPYEDQLDIIDLNGSSNTVSQQLLQDKGGTSSVSSIAISLLDKNGYATELITPGLLIDDILGRKANVYLGYQETAWPQDFVRMFAGVIDEVVGGTTVILNVAHPEQKKRAEIFQKITTELTQDAYFRAKNIQKILYQTRRDVVGTVTVTYTSGATAGSEVVTVGGNNIEVQIENGVTQARHIRDAIEKSIDALSLVTTKVDSGFSNQTQVLQAITSLDSDTTLNVASTLGMLLPVPSEGFRTCVRINDEIIEYTGLTATTITGCTRGVLEERDERAEGATHEAEDTVDTFYIIEGDAVEIALKIYMSGGPTYFTENIQIKSIVEIEGVGPVPNALWFENLNIQDAWGVSVGDLVTTTGDTFGANNVTDAPISEVIATPYGSYIVLSGVTLVSNLSSTGTASFASKWNVWPEGAGLALGGDEVDVPEFERLRETFSSSLFSYEFYLKDTMNAKDFVDTEVLYPTGAFTLPRRGKISAGYTTPPLGSAEMKVLNSSNTTKPGQTKVKRSINKYFYNNVLFKFNEAVTDDLFLSGDLEKNQESKTRIPVGNKTLVIEARGLRPGTDTSTIIEILKRRFQDKYKFGAEMISTFAFYGKTFNSDVGDVVVFGDSILNLPDTKKGTRSFAPRLFEVVNKSLAIKTGEVKLDIVDTGYSLADGRYGIISPSSLTVAVGSSGKFVKIKNSFETVSPQLERTKWTPYIGLRCVIHDDAWVNVFETIFLGFSASDNYLMVFQDTVPFAVGDDYVVDIAPYPESTDDEDQQLAKRVFVFTNPTVEVVTGISGTQVTVGAGDVAKFFVGGIALVRDVDWTEYSAEVKIDDITGTTITFDADLGFTPSAGYEIDFIGFKDEGAPYRYL